MSEEEWMNKYEGWMRMRVEEELRYIKFCAFRKTLKITFIALTILGVVIWYGW
jgi:hypothetical protein